MRWETRSYEPGDEMEILSLADTVFGPGKKTPEIWRWLYLENPVPDPVIGVTRDHETGAMVAHGAVIPLSGRFGGRPASFGLAMDAMTHPAYRGAVLGRRGAFLSTALHVIRRIEPRMPFAYGFPEERHLELGRLALGYVPLRPAPCMSLALPRAGTGNGTGKRARRAVRAFRSFGARANMLWRRVRDDYPFSLVRDSTYLNWRFRDIPHRRYRMLALTGSLGRWEGWLVFSVEGDEARIVDLLVPRRLPSACEALVEAALEGAAEAGATSCVTWMPEHAPGRPLLERVGFEDEEDRAQALLAVRIQDSSIRLEDAAHGFHFQMGDSDLY
jgi:hypothetical protein